MGGKFGSLSRIPSFQIFHCVLDLKMLYNSISQNQKLMSKIEEIRAVEVELDVSQASRVNFCTCEKERKKE